MIVVKLIGGIGNQMFQYAFGRNISSLKNVPLRLDISAFADYPLRNYEMKNFNISAQVATENEIRTARALGFSNKLKSRIKRIIPGATVCGEFNERHFHFDDRVSSLGANVYLNGYWQSERYFKGVEDIIRQEFTFKSNLGAENEELLRQISTSNSVSLHVRRGDYVENAETRSFHGICSVDYYERALKYITDRVSKPALYVFSDSPEWVEKNMVFDCPVTFVTGNSGDKSFEDLRLISHCKHQITANSTFSWWGAWLNRNPDRIVIAPRNWFAQNGLDTSDLIPHSWIRL